eukprot:351893-Chlamydomonas_euryale.AAC.23
MPTSVLLRPSSSDVKMNVKVGRSWDTTVAVWLCIRTSISEKYARDTCSRSCQAGPKFQPCTECGPKTGDDARHGSRNASHSI